MQYIKQIGGFSINKEKEPHFMIAAQYLSRKRTNIKH